MGTHPIFESDFDCLTESEMVERLSDEVKAMKRRGAGTVYCRLENSQTAVVAVPGPEQSEWSGGLYTIVVKCEMDYPATPPSVIFSPPIAHPNVTAEGTVSVPYLDQWTSKSTLTGLITSIYKLMSKPVVEQAVNLHAVYEFTAQSLSYKTNAQQMAVKLAPANKRHIQY